MAESEAYEAGKQKAAACMGCHGPDGNSMMPLFPKLAGLDPAYLVRQLEAFKGGEARKDQMMSPFAKELTERDMKELAAYYSAQKPNLDIPPAAAEIVAKGEAIYRGNRKGPNDAVVPACAGCHGPKAEGMPQAGYPYLRGQHAQYIAKQLRDFKAGTRTTDAAKMMRSTVLRMSEEDIDAVAQYIASLK